jgi:hypothetical protein
VGCYAIVDAMKWWEQGTQKICLCNFTPDLLDAVLCISRFWIALYLSTLYSMLYINVCTHFIFRTTIYNFYLLAMLLFACHTGAYMYELFGKFIDAMILEWQIS